MRWKFWKRIRTNTCLNWVTGQLDTGPCIFLPIGPANVSGPLVAPQWRIQKILVEGNLSTKPQKFECLRQNWERYFGRNRKFKQFFRPKSGGLQKKKRSSPKFRVIFRPSSEIQRIFCPKLGDLQKKKGLHQNWGCYFVQFRKFRRLRGAVFEWGGGYFPFFTWNRPQKHKKHAILHTSQANGGARAPPLPWLRYWVVYRMQSFYFQWKCIHYVKL